MTSLPSPTELVDAFIAEAERAGFSHKDACIAVVHIANVVASELVPNGIYEESSRSSLTPWCRAFFLGAWHRKEVSQDH